MKMDEIYCPECGSPNVIVYRDGSCECEDCEFQFHINDLG
jgi:transposase-like protein